MVANLDPFWISFNQRQIITIYVVSGAFFIRCQKLENPAS